MSAERWPVTPGPWRVGRGGCVVADAPVGRRTMDQRDVAFYGGQLVCESIASEADATLIAAAPDLLAEAKEALEYFTNRPGNAEAEVAARLRAVIARAEGQS